MHLKKTTTLAVAASAVVFGLTGCATSDEERTEAVAELAARGFEDVQYVDDDSVDLLVYDMLFTAKVGECRLDIARDADMLFEFRSVDMTDEQRQALTEKVGGSASDTVNASFVETYAAELGLQHCVSEASAM